LAGDFFVVVRELVDLVYTVGRPINSSTRDLGGSRPGSAAAGPRLELGLSGCNEYHTKKLNTAATKTQPRSRPVTLSLPWLALGSDLFEHTSKHVAV
jgi:hypothetical protein